jgi:hypothetical protein
MSVFEHEDIALVAMSVRSDGQKTTLRFKDKNTLDALSRLAERGAYYVMCVGDVKAVFVHGEIRNTILA